ncbi:MAG: adenosine-specific kinase [Thermovirgaceae bacterium]|nr:adenosine-specific kinase [Thermovirgaceae bacterium]
MTGSDIRWETVDISIPEGCNVILGQSHFIKTVEDLFEVLATSSPTLEFGIAFCEASGPCLIRTDGNSKDLIETAAENALRLAAGHSFIILMRNGYPISVMNGIKQVQEVCRIFAATANPLQVLVFESNQGRGVGGVIDGFTPKGIETAADAEERKSLLRNIIGYKR